ncbi:LLM class F420-dependent oxidoreductase, partial [Mycobacterium sp. ITM-2017-0098]
EFLTGVAELESAGVTWIQVTVPGDSLAHAVETIECFGSEVIAHLPVTTRRA